MAEQKAVTGWTGWVIFAGVILVIRGAMQALFGLGTLLKSTFLIVGQAHVAVVNPTAWGWIHLLVGIAVLAAGFSVMHGSTYGRVVGIMITALALVANLTYASAYPFWALAAAVLDVVILYSLIVHGGELRNA